VNSDQAIDSGAMLDAWRERGDHRFDAVRFRFIEALARRAAGHGGNARRILDHRLAQLVAAYGEALEGHRPTQGDTAAQPGKLPPTRGPLAQLVEHAARQAPAPAHGAATGDATTGLPPSSPELKSLSYFKSTWSRLSADRRLNQSLAKMPENAGPLNSHHLVHRSLTLMRDLSPDYLDRFMSYVDTLLWIEQATSAGGAAGAENPRAEGTRKAARGRSA
jgi:hypothetical protein